MENKKQILIKPKEQLKKEFKKLFRKLKNSYGGRPVVLVKHNNQ